MSSSPASNSRERKIWVALPCVGYPLAALLPYYIAFYINHVSLTTTVSFEFINGLLSTSGVLFGFSSLIIISKDWVDRKVWAILIPPLALLVASGMEIGNLALGFANGVEALVLCSTTFNATVVTTGFTVGYIIQRLPTRSIAAQPAPR
ncbi:MAG TPA: hypothetical protein VFE91_01770 [Nitrososphaerales archaeon]|nr:hypothetical protein [Nitrososphaerales archaeon]